jgi:hypothetical protein
LVNNNVINIHQSFWGEVNHGHGLIATSINDDTLNQVLSSFSDRPGSTYGQSIRPYFSGKKIGNFFVFTKSYPDNTSSRAGMVFTHALIFNIDDIINISNINFIFDLFPAELPSKPTLNASINPIQQQIVCNSDNKILYPKYLQSVVQLFIIGKLPIIFVGNTSSFILLITQIWKGFFPAIRENFSFQIAFAPNDIQQNKNLSLVFVPNTFLDKWTTHTIVDGEDDSIIRVENEAERLLLGNIVSNGFYSFIQDLNIQLDSFKKISICYRAYMLFNKLNICTVSEALQLVRSLAGISSRDNGNQIKSKSIDRLCTLLSSASEDEIRGLRNIDFSLFDDGSVKITKSIEQFLDVQFKEAERSQLSQFILDVHKTKENAIWWHQTIIRKVSQLLKSLSVSIVWDLINHQNGLLEYFAPHIDTTPEKELQFLSSYPKVLSSGLIKTVKKFAKNRKWYRLFGMVNLEIDSLQNALQEQLSLERDIDLHYQYSGLNIIVSSFSDKEFIELVVKMDIEKLNHIAADKCITNPKLLSQLDVQLATWRKIWVYSLEKTDDLSFGVSDLQSTIFKLFDLLLKNDPVDSLIIKKISELEYANIREYPERKSLWDKLPIEYKSEFISKTADSIIKSILNGNDEEVEPIIADRILTDNYINRVCSHATLKSILVIYDKFTSLEEKYLLAGIRRHVGDLEKSDSDRIGLLVRQKGWEGSAEVIFDKAKSNYSFRIALNQCKYLIPRWKRFLYSDIFNETLSETDYYDSLYELAISLYDRGPEDNNIWKKAGGDVSILANTDNRKEQWYSAIQHLRNGGGGKGITAYSFLEEMKKDRGYRYFTEINKLMEYFKK